MTEPAPRPAWAEIDLGAVRRNVARIGEKLNENTQFMAVVKANAYGHGDVGVARAALEAGATWLGVILVDEGVRLREAGIEAPILLLHEAPVDMARVGIAMYGLSPGPKLDGIVELEPVMTLKARAAMVKRVPAGEAVSYGLRYKLRRPGTVVSIPLGYADGWPRALGSGRGASKAAVLIGGKRYPAGGTVCMDAFMVALGD